MPLPCALAHALRFLSIDAVHRAQSGHSGMPLGMADIAAVLWLRFLKHNPLNPDWFDRDRFVLSNGHGSALLYALLHLSGYSLSIDDLKAFRQLHSKTPGHPEYGHTPGVASTTGPLGQGIANAVGMAIAEKVLANRFNTPDHELVNHYTWAFLGDGCLMEGISHEVCSLAGTLGLGKLIVFYDDNGISIDGKVSSWFHDDTPARFEAYGWHVIPQVDGHDMAQIEAAIIEAKACTTKPSLIACQTIIGFSSAHAGSEKAHGHALSDDDVLKLREALDWPYPAFEIPDDIYATWSGIDCGRKLEQDWLTRCENFRQSEPEHYAAFLRQINGDLPDDWDLHVQKLLNRASDFSGPIASRKASGEILSYFTEILPELFGGSADLSESTFSAGPTTQLIHREDFSGNYLAYGVRELGMSGMMNGMALHGGLIPFGGTFLVFSDYARSALRLSAMMKKRVIYIYSHDSIGVGEDGPTHQPIEHISSLRVIPNLRVWRPASFLETAVAWQKAIEHHAGPSCLLLSRQVLPAFMQEKSAADKIARGAYIVKDSDLPLDLILMATGSELSKALMAAQELMDSGIGIRVVSMPCMEVFLEQPQAYQEEILPNLIRKRIAIEAAVSASWHRFIGLDGEVIGLDEFGLSAPADVVYEYFDLTVARIIASIKRLAEKK